MGYILGGFQMINDKSAGAWRSASVQDKDRVVINKCIGMQRSASSVQLSAYSNGEESVGGVGDEEESSLD